MIYDRGVFQEDRSRRVSFSLNQTIFYKSLLRTAAEDGEDKFQHSKVCREYIHRLVDRIYKSPESPSNFYTNLDNAYRSYFLNTTQLIKTTAVSRFSLISFFIQTFINIISILNVTTLTIALYIIQLLHSSHSILITVIIVKFIDNFVQTDLLINITHLDSDYCFLQP